MEWLAECSGMRRLRNGKRDSPTLFFPNAVLSNRSERYKEIYLMKSIIIKIESADKYLSKYDLALYKIDDSYANDGFNISNITNNKMKKYFLKNKSVLIGKSSQVKDISGFSGYTYQENCGPTGDTNLGGSRFESNIGYNCDTNGGTSGSGLVVFNPDEERYELACIHTQGVSDEDGAARADARNECAPASVLLDYFKNHHTENLSGIGSRTPLPRLRPTR